MELVVRIDMKDLLDQIPEKVTVTEQVVPVGYKCQDCWRGDGRHELTCPFYKVEAAHGN